MDNENRLEKQFRNKLSDLEYPPEPGNWEKIARTLEHTESGRKQNRASFSGKKKIGTYRLYRIAAALILLLLATGTFRLVHEQQSGKSTGPQKKSSVMLSENGKVAKTATDSDPAISGKIEPVSPSVPNGIETKIQPTENTNSIRKNFLSFSGEPVHPEARNQERSRPKDTIPAFPDKTAETLLPSAVPELVLADVVRQPVLRKSFFRNWRLGMGGSSIGLAGISTPSWGNGNENFYNDVDSDPSAPDSLPATRFSYRADDEESEVKHAHPLSFGFSLSHPLTERLSLNTGLTYTYLYSRWRYKHTQGTARRQRLHLIGLPVSVSYRLNDWKRPYCYATAGLLAEVNVAGRLSTAKATHRIRIPGVLWTANARIGLAYPLIRYLSVYGEAGLCYYFDYHSDIETIRSKDPFKVSAQIGLRLNL